MSNYRRLIHSRDFKGIFPSCYLKTSNWQIKKPWNCTMKFSIQQFMWLVHAVRRNWWKWWHQFSNCVWKYIKQWPQQTYYSWNEKNNFSTKMEIWYFMRIKIKLYEYKRDRCNKVQFLFRHRAFGVFDKHVLCLAIIWCVESGSIQQLSCLKFVWILSLCLKNDIKRFDIQWN